MQSTNTNRTVIIAALDRELHPLVQGWKAVAFSCAGRTYHAYENNEKVAFAGGIGRQAAANAARAAVEKYQPAMLVSVGFAGALIRSLKVGNVIAPNVIVDAATGNEYRCDIGGGVLVSAAAISDAASKHELVQRFHALAVDMEAAAVAEIARSAQIGFRCVKAISDEAEFAMPPLNEFVDADGNFHTGRFVLWTAIRPWRWPQVIALGRNSSKAGQALSEWLRHSMAGGFPAARVARIDAEETDATGGIGADVSPAAGPGIS